MSLSILETIDLYVNGVKASSSEMMKPAFHKDATMYGFDASGKLVAQGHIQNLYDIMDHGEPQPEFKMPVQILDETPNTASVKVVIEKESDGTYLVDYHNLIRTEEGWKIISKVFYTR